MRIPKSNPLVWPDDVFRKPWEWRLIGREEACFLCSRAHVVVVSRPGGAAPISAEWLTPGTALYPSHGPYGYRYLTYYVHEEEEERGIAPTGPDTGPLSSESQEEDVGVPVDDSGPHQEEEEPDALPDDEAAVLTRAAQEGVPFCEICEQQRQQQEA